MNVNKEKHYEAVPTDIENENKIPTSLPGFGVRHFQMIILFTTVTVIIITRAHVGATIVGMTSKRYQNGTSNNYILMNNDSFLNTTAKIDEISYEIYDWPKSIQEMVLNAFFLGYATMMLPMAMFIQRYGGKLPLQISLFANGIISLLTPWLTSWGGWKALCACRVIQGVSQTGTWSSMQALLGQWVPLSERGRLSSYVYIGPTLGTVIAFQLAGVLSQTSLGWPLMFYVIGVLCLLCFIFLTIFGASSPVVHKTITDDEKNFIMGHRTKVKQAGKIPWKTVLTSKAAWGCLCAQIGMGLTNVYIANQIPSYIYYICRSDVRNSGFLSSLPFIASIFTTPLFGIISDFLTNRNIVSIKNARRMSNSMSLFGVAFGLLATSFTTSTLGAIVWLIISAALFSGWSTGFVVNHNDIAPNFSATLMSIGNVLYNIFVLILPIVTSFVIKDMTNVYQWRIMISIIAGICCATNIAFVTLMSADVQPWNDEAGFSQERELRE